MIFPIIKFLHVICGVSLFGILIANFFYIAWALNKHDKELLRYSIRTSYFGDALILLCLLVQFATALYLVPAGHFTLKMPWIFVAYHAFGLLAVIWLSFVFVKKFYFSRETIKSYSIKIFYALNILMITILILIIHDAVMRQTGFEFLFRK